MTNKEFIITHKLQLMHKLSEAKYIRKALKKANKNYVLEHEEVRNGNFVCFDIWCPTTTFALAYCNLGKLIEIEFQSIDK